MPAACRRQDDGGTPDRSAAVGRYRRDRGGGRLPGRSCAANLRPPFHLHREHAVRADQQPLLAVAGTASAARRFRGNELRRPLPPATARGPGDVAARGCPSHLLLRGSARRRGNEDQGSPRLRRRHREDARARRHRRREPGNREIRRRRRTAVDAAARRARLRRQPARLGAEGIRRLCAAAAAARDRHARLPVDRDRFPRGLRTRRPRDSARHRGRRSGPLRIRRATGWRSGRDRGRTQRPPAGGPADAARTRGRRITESTMYERFYRLRERPFALTPDPDYLYPSRVHKEALGYLRYGIETQAGFVVITGAIGSGKTTLLQTLLRGLDSQTTVARVMNTLLDPRELLESAMIDVDLDPGGKSKPTMLKEFGEFLVNERSAGRIVLLVIDEAQNLSLPALEEIRMLSNLETEKSKLLQIVLIGQPDLRDKLDRPELEQLRQRITVSYHLEALDADETAHYVNHRLARASIAAALEFPRDVTDRIHTRSGGVPRLINVIADATLVFGYGEERSEIDAALIRDVITDLDAIGVLGPRSNPNRHASVVPADPIAAATALHTDGLRVAHSSGVLVDAA